MKTSVSGSNSNNGVCPSGLASDDRRRLALVPPMPSCLEVTAGASLWRESIKPCGRPVDHRGVGFAVSVSVNHSI